MDKYSETLDSKAFTRYQEKTAVIGGIDPYQIDKCEWISGDNDVFPEIIYPDLVNYLIFQPSPFYTLKDFQNYKSLESFDRFLCGWVRDLCVYRHKPSGHSIVKARVMHSMKLSETSLTPWLITDNESKIISAHCDCKAGLGESCSHVASVLFYVEAICRMREKRTVTQKPAYWMLPTSKTSVPYAPLHEIDFTSVKTLKKQLDKQIETNSVNSQLNRVETPGKKTTVNISQARYDSFFETLKADKPVCLAVMKKYNADYVPKSLHAKYPKVLSELTDEKCKGMVRDELIEHCSTLLPSIVITEEEASNVEQATRQQAKSKLWFRFRTGRITSSRIKAACATSCDTPSYSLLKQICYPHEHSFSNAAMQWGCDHEDVARKQYTDMYLEKHLNFKTQPCGLFLNKDYPHLGASPDGIVECDCCGRGCIEVKCLYYMRDENVSAKKGSCLEETHNGLKLKENHAYYSQVQTHIHIADVDYCDFVVWTPKDIYIQRIEANTEVWKKLVDKSTKFFATVILPELVGKFYSDEKTTMSVQKKPLSQSESTNKTATTSKPATRGKKSKAKKDATKSTKSSPDANRLDTSEENLELYCICYGARQEVMVGCDSEDCPNKPFEWFHLSCVNLKAIPEGDWFCPDCLEGKFLRSLKRK